ncbi:MAG: nucleotidyltransferase family protein [Gammaproteobacteria bacterium]|nr:nucleotidyltransferase family protein [Gammaproteobacteria bacterium]
MSTPRRAIVLAAGRGERMRPLTDVTPKPLLQAGGRPLIEYHLLALAGAGVTEVVVNLSWLGAQLRDALGDGARFGLAIRYSDEGPVALETGGGIFRALPWLGPEPFLVVNGDIYSDYPLRSLRLAPGLLGQLVLVPNPEQHPRGDFHLTASGLIADGEPRHTYSGIAIFDPELFAGCSDGRFPLKPLLDRAIEAGRLGGELHNGLWTDVGTPARLAALDQRLTG